MEEEMSKEVDVDKLSNGTCQEQIDELKKIISSLQDTMILIQRYIINILENK
jgi:hypothetical protein